MRIDYHGINAADLRGSTIADYLVNIEADFELSDEAGVIYSEFAFPIAELARELARWIAQGEDVATDFSFSSLSFPEPGSVTITRSGSGWTAGSMFADDRTPAPVPWAVLARGIEGFVEDVRKDVAALGIDPSFIGATRD
ncbi:MULTISPECIES: hypothetical protein [Kitasatospora]|uniref:DUF7878 domain-containing protein n=1 Tax=Kitasatospora setae (strain ATCC 33774 / DSM 43861 / JCM 3304 / KCC A-0304 / NBRC 14216 / KM-6054) TaxID=452652 RepID=E4N9C1_KITSK|nr:MULTISPECIES: hypothetical protein [Kitasatospora]BAJ27802.1 hypothetical protein KSE_19790 [Kitasatospora setae KM-6054]